MSKNTLRWITTRLSFITAVFVTMLILAGWLSHPIDAAPAARPGAQSQVAGVGLYDDYDSVFRYSGHWQSGNYYSSAYNNTMHYTTDAAARAALTFQGTGFILYRVTYANRGVMNVYIDGNLYASPNNYSDAPVWQAPLVINGLPDGVHTVEFANSAANVYMDIDAVRVLEGNVPPPSSSPTMTVHPVTATVFVPPTDTPVGALPNLSVNQSQPLIPQVNTNTPSPTPTDVPNSVSASTGIITPIPTAKGLIFSGEVSTTANNLFTVNPIAGDTPVVALTNVSTAPGFNYPVWSPDGKSVAFSDASGNLQILNVTAGTYSAPSTVAITISSPVAWDPSGAKRIAYIDGAAGNALKAVDFSSSTAVITTLIATTGAGTGYSQVSWNKTANLITFQAAGTTTNSQIDSISAACIPSGVCTANSALDAGANGAISSDPAWSPNGTKLAYVSNRGGQTGANNDVYVFDTTTSVSTKVSSGTSSKHSPAWNVTGTQLVYVDSQTVIDLVDKANTITPVAPVTITSATVGSLTSVSWSSLYVGPPTATPLPTQTSTPSATPVTLTGGTLTVDNSTPVVGAPVTFTFTVTNTTNLTFTSVSAQLQVNGTTMVPLSGLTAATPTSMTPGATAIFKFTYTTSATDTCNLSPVASFSGALPAIGGVVPAPATLVLSQLTSGGPIIEQRIGLTAAGVLPTSGTTTVGQTLTTTVNVTNSGCLPLTAVSGYTSVNNTKTSDSVTSSGNSVIQLPVGNSVTFTSTHTVTSSDISTAQLFPDSHSPALVSLTHADLVDPNRVAARATTGVVVSYTFSISGQTTTVPSTTLTATVVTSTTTYTTGTSASGTATAAAAGTSTALGLTKTASVTSIAPGGTFNYTITVTNNTGALISSLLISDSLPTGVTAGTITVSPSTCPSTVANGSLTVTCSSLAPAQVVSVTFPVTVLKSISTGTSISNTANASYSGGNATPSTVSVAVANGASSLPVTGFGSDQQTPVGLIALAILVIGAIVFSARRYMMQRHVTPGK